MAPDNAQEFKHEAVSNQTQLKVAGRSQASISSPVQVVKSPEHLADLGYLPVYAVEHELAAAA